MKSSNLGKKISAVEITNISQHGIWLLAHGEELFMSYNDFPWFKGKTVEDILDVEEISSEHYYWPTIDVDLTRAIIKNPKKFPLKAHSP